jgi:release factor glutamine methyltransferase
VRARSKTNGKGGLPVAEIWTIQRLLAWTSDYFTRKSIDSPRLTAELLLAHTLGCDRVRLYMDYDRPIDKGERDRFRALIERRAEGEPAHYLLGYREFFGRRFEVDPRVLIPRPETELAVEAALKRLAADARGPVLDLCTGSGCIGLTLAAERSSLQVVAADQSEAALEVARKNAAELGVADRVELVAGDLFEPLTRRAFALIVSNPPYVAAGALASLMREVQREPRLALDGGSDGLSVLRRIISEAPGWLEPGGSLILEIGDDQGEAVRSLLSSSGFEQIAIEKDAAGLERLASAVRP